MLRLAGSGTAGSAQAEAVASLLTHIMYGPTVSFGVVPSVVAPLN